MASNDPSRPPLSARTPRAGSLVRSASLPATPGESARSSRGCVGRYARGLRDAFRDEEHTISPKEDVYSYFMFAFPVAHRFLDQVIAIGLIALGLFMQGVILYAIFNNVVLERAKWQDKIVDDGSDNIADKMDQMDRMTVGQVRNMDNMSLDKVHGNLQGGLGIFDTAGEQCVTGHTLCTARDGVISCAPPTIQLTGRWDELDLDGDGIWTYEEATVASNRIKCKYGVDAVETFHVIQRFVQKRDHILWVHPDLRKGRAIHKAYFTYAVGDIIMCGYRDERMCANLLHSGVFDVPLELNTVPRIGNDTESAMDYCYEMLRPHGICERILPSTYSTWKMESVAECGDTSYNSWLYNNPATGERKSFLLVDYEIRKEYKEAQYPLFLIYKTILISMWILTMTAEAKSVYTVILWVRNFPAHKEVSQAIYQEWETPRGTVLTEPTIEILAVTRTHRALVGVAIFLRAVMIVTLTLVGTTLLLRSNDWIDLLFDAVSLAFVVEIAGLLYSNVLRQEKQDEFMRMVPMKLNSSGFAVLESNPGVADTFWLFCGVGAAIGVMYYNHVTTVEPMSAALDCACMQTGDSCFEASTFSKDFWHDYWKNEVPEVFLRVDGLRKQYGARGFGNSTLGNATARNATAPGNSASASSWVDKEADEDGNQTDRSDGKQTSLMSQRLAATVASNLASNPGDVMSFLRGVGHVASRQKPRWGSATRARHFRQARGFAESDNSLRH